MIIEAMTAYTAVKITWETLEILHLLHVGHETGKYSYRAGSFITDAMQQRLQKRLYKKNPALQFVHEAKTDYDFQATGNADQAIEKHNQQAQAYLNLLNESLGILNAAKKDFLNTHSSLEELIKALNLKDEIKFSSYLSKFKINFESFKDNFGLFSLKIKSPDRKNLYISDIAKEIKSIERFNTYLKNIDKRFNELKETKEKIASLFDNGFHAISTFLPEANSSSALSFEQLQEDIKQCMHDPERISETMQKILPKNTELANLCTEIAQISTAFKQIDSTDNEQTNLWNDDPNWLPLLTEEKQIEVGQRIVLHAMNEAIHSENKKLLLAKIFLQQHVSKYVINQIEVNLFSHEMACILRSWQIKRCEQMIQFLSRLTQGAILPNVNLDGLLEWLKTKRKIQSATALLTEVLVSPCCFKQHSIESALANFKRLAPDESARIIQQHLESHWGAIWEKNDALIRLPESFDSSILPRHRRELENQTQNLNVVSSVMYKLAAALTADLQQLKGKLENHLTDYLDVMLTSFKNKLKEASEAQKNQEHEAGVSRIKEAYRYIPAITSPSNSLFPYLYRAGMINEVEKKQQVPTQDDLLHVIYKGVDPNGVCYWKSSSSQPYSQSNQLLYYFFPSYQNDSRTKAWIYACTDCQVNAFPIFSHLFSPNARLLALGNTPEENIPEEQTAIKNSLSIQAILRGPTERSSIATHSKALNGVAPKTAQETETVLQELKNYFMLALVRVNPEYRNELPLKKQFECLIKNFFKFGQEIGEERLESVQLYIGDLCAVLSAKDVNGINKALDDLKINHENRFTQAQKVDSSALYTIMKKAFEGPISYIIKKINEVHQKDFKEEETKLEGTMESLQESLEEVKQEKEVLKTELKETKDQLKESEAQRVKDKEAMEAKLKESEAQRVKDKEAMEAQRERDKEAMEAQRVKDKEAMEAKLKESEAHQERDKADSEAKLKELEAKFEAKLNKLFARSTQHQQAPTPDPASDTKMSGTDNNTHLFRL
jgi:hypothetical protein